jgi:hypothetical protein
MKDLACSGFTLLTDRCLRYVKELESFLCQCHNSLRLRGNVAQLKNSGIKTKGHF